jgi:hypothetical protein
LAVHFAQFFFVAFFSFPLFLNVLCRIQRSVSQLIVCIEQTHEEDEDGCFEDSEELKRSRKASDATKLRKMFGAGVQVSTVDAFQVARTI